MNKDFTKCEKYIKADDANKTWFSRPGAGNLKEFASYHTLRVFGNSRLALRILQADRLANLLEESPERVSEKA